MGGRMEMDKKDIFAVILAGGAGTRFWPLSREQWPKQFLKIGGGKNLIARTVDRARQVTGGGEVVVVAGRELSEKIRLQLFGEDLTFVVEPEAKNTAPAIALAARFIHEQNREGIMVVLPSDHIIKHEDLFRQAIERAVAAAREGYLVTLGILPGKPETGYGYIKMGREVSAGVHAVSRFTEKPDREEAERFLREGGYYWNSGMFIWRADTFLTRGENASSPALRGYFRTCAGYRRAGERVQKGRPHFRRLRRHGKIGQGGRHSL